VEVEEAPLKKMVLLAELMVAVVLAEVIVMEQEQTVAQVLLVLLFLNTKVQT
jgi:hypothetical protein